MSQNTTFHTKYVKITQPVRNPGVVRNLARDLVIGNLITLFFTIQSM